MYHVFVVWTQPGAADKHTVSKETKHFRDAQNDMGSEDDLSYAISSSFSVLNTMPLV